MSELKRCPFCGGEAELITTYDAEMVQCKKCFAKTQTFIGDYYDEGQMCGMYAIPAWNTRKPMERMVEQLEEQREESATDYYDWEDISYLREKEAYQKAIEIVKEAGGING